jgi:hypothetical protein
MSRKITATDVLLILLVLIVVGIIIPPAILYQREESRASTCENNLRQFGIGMNIFGERDARKRYCSGAFDWKRDGCPDTNSWIGNLVDLGAAEPGKMLCPANKVRGLNTLNDLIGSDPRTAVGPESISMPPTLTHTAGVKQGWITDTICRNFVTTLADGTANEDGTLANGSPGRISVVRQAIADGYNSNYAASWFLVRQTPRFTRGSDDIAKYLKKNISENDSGPYARPPSGFQKVASRIFMKGNQIDLSGAFEGLTVRFAEKSHVATSAIPLLGDAAEDRAPEAVLSETLSPTLLAGQRLGKSFGAGPVFWVKGAKPPQLAPLMRICSVDEFDPKLGGLVDIKTIAFDDTLPLPDKEGMGGVDFNTPPDGVFEPLDAPFAYGGLDDNLILQDTRAFQSVHTQWKTKFVVMVFADASTKRVYDNNRDGFLNPGFPIDKKLGKTVLETSVGYTNIQTEVGPATMYNGPYLDFTFIKKMTCDFDTNELMNR